MKTVDIIDFSDCEYSSRDGTYGGQAGDKDGIRYHGENWLIKYPKSTRGMDVQQDISYTTSPLSEFIGSHIYEILGYDVHQTLLGIRNHKIVVACKDFAAHEGALRELRTLKNASNKELSEILEKSFSSTGSDRMVDVDETLLHLAHNRILSKVDGVAERFWECAVIDILINNNDRNNGNWGLLYEKGAYRLAPIFDNGASFSSTVSEEKIHRILAQEERLMQSSLNTITGYGKNSHQLTSQKFLRLEYPGLKAAIVKTVPLMEAHFAEITAFINAIPETFQGYEIISSQRKELYIKSMELRLKHLLVPYLMEIQEKMKGRQR